MDDAKTRKYHVAHQGRKFGPLSLVELSSRRLSSDMLVWCEGMPEWIPIGDMPELRSYVHHAVASHTVAPPTAPTAAMVRPTAAATYPGDSSVPVAGSPVPAFLPPQPPAPPTGGGGRIKFLGITTIILSCVGLLCCPLALFAAIATDQEAAAAGLATLGSAGFGVVRNILVSGVIFVSIPMLAAGIGLLYRRRWAAITMLVSSVICVLLNLGLAVIVCMGGLPLLQHAGELEEPEVGALGGMVIGVLAYLTGIIWHVTAILLVNSKAVRQNLR